MKSLTQEEILSELKKLGVDVPAELGTCLREYEEYLNTKNEEDDLTEEIAANE